MRVALNKLWNDVSSSYWFIPTLMALSAAALATALTGVDALVAEVWWRDSPLLLVNQPSGARALLAALAGSMITVAGVTFSVTISSVAYATAQFGPRLLTSFMRDRGNQVTLGTFIATFVYCVLVLRTVRGAEEVQAGTRAATDLAQAFVPQTAMLAAVALALASVAVLIYFIHHVPASIHVSNVAARIGSELKQHIAARCDDGERERAAGEGVLVDEDEVARRYAGAAPLAAGRDGYLQHSDMDGLVELASQRDLTLFVVRGPGDFLIRQQTMLYVWPSHQLDDDFARAARACFAYGPKRTPTQDVGFQVQELIEIAVRALSPGVNDPFTAINCMDWLAAALAALTERTPPPARRFDDGGRLRVVATTLSFATLSDLVFDGLRPYVAGDRIAALHLLDVIARLLAVTSEPGDRQRLADHASALYRCCRQTLMPAAEQAAAARAYAQVRRVFRHGEQRPPRARSGGTG